MVVHALNPSSWDAEAGGSQLLQGSHFYKASSRIARTIIQRNPVIKNQLNLKKNYTDI